MDLEPGTYLICEVVRANWTQSAPSSTPHTTARCDWRSDVCSTDLSSGTFGGRDFGNYTTGTVSGTKYEDPNADGTLTDGTRSEERRVGKERTYTDAATPVFVKSTTTSTTDGTYSMDLEPGSYLICEVVRANWTQSAPGNTACSSVSGAGAGAQHVTATSPETFGGRDLSNYTTGTVSGTKYEDPNADGTLTDGT